MKDRKRVAIVGLGLIGCSMAIRMHERKVSSHLIGVDSNDAHAAIALDYEYIDEVLPLKEAIEQSEVIVLAVPVDQSHDLVKSILDLVTTQIVFDVGSTKKPIINVLDGHENRGRFVATHPMWGTEYSGPGAAVRNAFKGKAVIICNKQNSDANAVQWVEAMYESIGMHIIQMSADEHDMHTAYVSHISHITSFALANTVLNKEKQASTIFELASSGFESTVRLAKSNAAMWVPILSLNKSYILEVLHEHIEQLQAFFDCIKRNDLNGIEGLINQANQVKKIIK